jgi:hypothetical protein
MQEFQQRVLEEKKQLDERLEKLTAFINGSKFETLDAADQERLHHQQEVMREYAQILAERIADFLPSDGTAGDRTLE